MTGRPRATGLRLCLQGHVIEGRKCRVCARQYAREYRRGLRRAAPVPPPRFNGAEAVWTDLAACRDHDPDLWFPEGNAASPEARARVARATAICFGCPVQRECFDLAMSLEKDVPDSSRFGIWGGFGPQFRGDLAWKRAREAGVS